MNCENSVLTVESWYAALICGRRDTDDTEYSGRLTKALTENTLLMYLPSQ